MSKGIGIPYLIARKGRGQTHRYYWQPSSSLRAQGWRPERLPDDFEAACIRAREINSQLPSGPAAEPEPRAVHSQGIYVIQAGTDGPVKIGVARSIGQRLQALQTGSGLPLTLHLFIRLPTGKAVEVEGAIHRRLGTHRQAGEWFTASPAMAVAEISREVLALTESEKLSDKRTETPQMTADANVLSV